MTNLAFENVAPEDFSLTLEEIEGRYGCLRFFYHQKKSQHVVVFIHGIGADWRFWIPYLGGPHSRRTDILLVELPGFGGSEFDSDSMSLDAIKDDIFAFAETFGWKSIDLVGHSMGGFLAIHCAISPPAPLRKVVAISGAYSSILKVAKSPLTALLRTPQTALLYWSIRAIALASPKNRLARLIKSSPRLTDLLVSPFATQALPAGSSSYMIRNMHGTPLRVIEEIGKNYSVEDEWARLGVPVYMLFGSKDKLVPAREGVRARKLSSMVTPLVIPSVGHLLPLEDPDLLERVLDVLLTE